MYLGIEIGGTKLQLGVGRGDGSPCVALERREVVVSQGAEGILRQIQEVGGELIRQHAIQRIGIGFGGPVDVTNGRVLKSHQVAGWEGFPLADWCHTSLGSLASIGNDCDCAALAEARFGAGRGKSIVFYVTVGTGIGGGLVIDGQLQGSRRPAVAEIGHLRPGLEAASSDQTVESLASGPGIVAAVQRLIAEAGHMNSRSKMSQVCGGDVDALTAKQVAELAIGGNEVARTALQQALCTLGWAIAQVITITAAEVIVVGGGVSLLGEEHFFQPLRQQIARYVFPPLAAAYEVVPAALGEEVVVHGACALAASVGR